jgi:hypothetical protein
MRMRFAGLQPLRAFVTLAVGEVEDAVADAGGRAVRKHLAQRHGDQRVGPVHGDLERHLRSAKHLDGALQGRGIKHELAALLHPLVLRLIGPRAVGAPFAGGEPRGLR